MLKGAALAEEEIRLLAAGARVSADLASLPGAARPAGIAASWEPAAASLAHRVGAIMDEHGGGQPEVAAFGSLAEAEIARQHGRDGRATWRAVADAWQRLGQPYREAYARLREAGAAVRAGRREQGARALAACESLARQLPSAPLLALAEDLARRSRLGGQPRPAARPAPARAQFDLTDRESRRAGPAGQGRQQPADRPRPVHQ